MSQLIKLSYLNKCLMCPLILLYHALNSTTPFIWRRYYVVWLGVYSSSSAAGKRCGSLDVG